MFNQIGFNSLPFNRPFSVDIYGSFALEANGDISVIGNLTASPSFDLTGGGELLFDAIRERFGTFILEGIGEMETSGIRDRFGQFDFQAVGELSFNAGRNRIDFIEFDGEFKPGDRIVIDSNNLKFTLNGTNALHLMSGDFFDLNIGINELIYTDTQTNRNILIRITYRDKFV